MTGEKLVKCLMSVCVLLACCLCMARELRGDACPGGVKCDALCREVTKWGNAGATSCVEVQVAWCFACNGGGDRCCPNGAFPPLCAEDKSTTYMSRACTPCTLNCTIAAGSSSDATCTGVGAFTTSPVFFHYWKCVQKGTS